MWYYKLFNLWSYYKSTVFKMYYFLKNCDIVDIFWCVFTFNLNSFYVILCAVNWSENVFHKITIFRYKNDSNIQFDDKIFSWKITCKNYTVLYRQFLWSLPVLLDKGKPENEEYGLNSAIFVPSLLLQWSLTYPDPTFLDYYTDTFIYIEIVSPIRKFNYPDNHLGNGGVRISEGPLYIFDIYHYNNYFAVHTIL